MDLKSTAHKIPKESNKQIYAEPFLDQALNQLGKSLFDTVRHMLEELECSL